MHAAAPASVQEVYSPSYCTCLISNCLTVKHLPYVAAKARLLMCCAATLGLARNRLSYPLDTGYIGTASSDWDPGDRTPTTFNTTA